MPTKLRPGYNWRVHYQLGDDPAVKNIVIIGVVTVEAAAAQARDLIRDGDALAGDFNIVAVQRIDFHKLPKEPK